MRQPELQRGARALVALSTIASLGCATMFGSTTGVVAVETDPAGARIEVHPSSTTAVSPAKLELSKRQSHRVVISKDGYRTVELGLRREVAFVWWFLGAFTLGVSIGIDLLTGAIFDIRPDYIFVPLEPEPAESASPSAGISRSRN